MQQVCIGCSLLSFSSPRKLCQRLTLCEIQLRIFTREVTTPFCGVVPLVGERTDWSEANLRERADLMDGGAWVLISPSFICCFHLLESMMYVRIHQEGQFYRRWQWLLHTLIDTHECGIYSDKKLIKWDIFFSIENLCFIQKSKSK